MREPIWLTIDQIKGMHARQLSLFGGPPGIRDEGALASAIGRPINRWAYGGEADLAALAAAYAFGIARNHPFVDGNKRAAFLAMATFLILNGIPFTAEPDEAAAIVLALASGDLDEDALARWLRDVCVFGPDETPQPSR